MSSSVNYEAASCLNLIEKPYLASQFIRVCCIAEAHSSLKLSSLYFIEHSSDPNNSNFFRLFYRFLSPPRLFKILNLSMDGIKRCNILNRLLQGAWFTRYIITWCDCFQMSDYLVITTIRLPIAQKEDCHVGIPHQLVNTSILRGCDFKSWSWHFFFLLFFAILRLLLLYQQDQV